MPEYLKLPVRFGAFFEKGKLDTCGLMDSIVRNLHLLITTSMGENKQDMQYGAQFWDTDYDIHMTNDARRQVIINTLKQQISQYEKRLMNVVVEVNVRQAEYKVHTGGPQLRRRVEITISGQLTRSREPFRFATGFFIGPLSFD